MVMKTLIRLLGYAETLASSYVAMRPPFWVPPRLLNKSARMQNKISDFSYKDATYCYDP